MFMLTLSCHGKKKALHGAGRFNGEVCDREGELNCRIDRERGFSATHKSYSHTHAVASKSFAQSWKAGSTASGRSMTSCQ